MTRLVALASIILIMLSLARATARFPVQTKPANQLKWSESSSAAPTGSVEPNLFVARDGRVFLSWVEAPEKGTPSFRFAVRSHGAWSNPRTVIEAADLFVNPVDIPSLSMLSTGKLAAQWQIKTGAGMYNSDIRVALSPDEGRTWGRPVTPHRDGVETEHRFVSLVPWPDGKLGIFWLDGRNVKSEGTSQGHGTGHQGHGATSGEMSIRYTTIDDKGTLSDDVLLDGRVCDCCQTGAALTGERALVVYRDRSRDEIRDISVIALFNGRSSEPRSVHDDGWHIEGCPVNGPAVSAAARHLAVGWLTAANNNPAVNVALSHNGGETFDKAVRVDDGAPLGRVTVAAIPDGSVLVSWVEKVPAGAEIRVRRVAFDGSLGNSFIVAPSSVARTGGLPKLQCIGGDAIFAWTETVGVPRVRVKIANANDIR